MLPSNSEAWISTPNLMVFGAISKLRESGRCIDALKKRGKVLKKRGRVLKKRGRVLKKRGRVLKKVCLVRGTRGGRLLQKGGRVLKNPVPV